MKSLLLLVIVGCCLFVYAQMWLYRPRTRRPVLTGAGKVMVVGVALALLATLYRLYEVNAQ